MFYKCMYTSKIQTFEGEISLHISWFRFLNQENRRKAYFCLDVIHTKARQILLSNSLTSFMLDQNIKIKKSLVCLFNDLMV